MRWYLVAALLSVAWDLSIDRTPSVGWALVCAVVLGPLLRRL
jgi:hypothetical protein